MAEKRRLLDLFVPQHSNRSSMTCRMRCGDACFHEVPNTSENEYFGDVVTSAISRRGLLRAAAVVGAAGAAGISLRAVGGSAEAYAAPFPSITDFTAIKPSTADAVVVPEGFTQQTVIRWGDKLFSAAPDFDPNNQSAAAQKQQFGYNNDFLGFFPVDSKTELMMVNHEYTNEYIMHPNYDETNPTKEQVEIGWAAHGLSVVAVATEAGSGKLAPIVDHKLNRRFHTSTEFELTGPVAGHELVQTTADPAGTTALGTLNNCSGGLTPWGTWLTAEENFNQYFANADSITDEVTAARLKRYGVKGTSSERQWEKFDDRFDLAKEPNEVNRFGWIVEIDPFDPESTPKKRTALGRFKHEAATIRVAVNGKVAAYMGDDEKFDYLYKFISAGTMAKGGDNSTLLDEGTLYVAKFTGNSPAAEIDGTGNLPTDQRFDGQGTWIPLVTGTESHVEGMSAEEVLLFTRQASDKKGATKMDRPEDVEPHPNSGYVYVALTNNSDRGAEGKEGATEPNPRNSNKHGSVLELIEGGNDSAATDFTWNLLLVCGDPEDPSTYFGGFDKSQVSPISCPDNVAFGPDGDLWISTDGNQLGAHDGLYSVGLGDAATAPEGVQTRVARPRGNVRQFLSVPNGAECCGPWVTSERVNVAIQHPGETDEASFEAPSSHFPDGGSTIPRPSIMSAWPNADMPTPTTSPTAPGTEAPSPTGSPTAPGTGNPGGSGAPGEPNPGRPTGLPSTGEGSDDAGVGVAAGVGLAALGGLAAWRSRGSRD